MIMHQIQTTDSVSDIRSRLFTSRTTPYKIGIFLLFPSLILYLISFGSSSWFQSRSRMKNSWGLWHYCEDGVLECDKRLKTLLAMQYISCFCVAGYLLTVTVALYENCRQVPSTYHSRKLEWITLGTAFVGTVANFIFLNYYISLLSVSLGSSYLLNSSALTLLYGAGCLIACGNRAQPARRGVVMSSPEQQTMVYYSHGQPGAQVQTQVYNYHSPHGVSQPGSSYTPMAQPYPAPHQVMGPNMSSPYPPAYPPPPPYALPPAYPGAPPPNYVPLQGQGHNEPSAPLLTGNQPFPNK